jgi:hypothetical protein
LRYTAHDQPTEELGDLLSAFDQVYQESNRGGQHKRAMLSLRRANQITFAAGNQLHLILQEFSDLFNARYLEGPSSPDIAAYSILQQQFPTDHLVLQRNHVHIHNQRKEQLQTSEFVLDLLRAATRDRSLWPRNDNSAIQSFNRKPLTLKKRQSDIAKLESARHSQPKKFKPVGEEDRHTESSSGDKVHSSEEDVFL